jgi:hypothetical protein
LTCITISGKITASFGDPQPQAGSLQNSPRIILLLEATRGFDRGLVSGVARYSALNGPWTFYRQPHGYLSSKRRLDLQELKAWKPDGAICPTCHVLGYGVPEDVFVIGVDDDQYVRELQNPPLSSVRMASEQARYEAAALLDRLMHGEDRMSDQRVMAHATGGCAEVQDGGGCAQGTHDVRLQPT